MITTATPLTAGPRVLSLAEAVRLARTHAAVTFTARANVEVAKAAVAGARATLYPRITGTASGGLFASNGAYFFNGAVTPTGTQKMLYADSGLTLDWMLFDFGHRTQTVAAAESGVDAAALTARAAQEEAVRSTAIAYLELAADQRTLETTREILAQRERMLTTTDALARSGVRPPLEKTRAEVAARAAREELALAEGQRESDAEELGSLIGLAPGEPVEVEPLAAIGAIAAVPRDPSSTIERRPDLVAADKRIDEASHASSAARRAYLPVFSATAGLTGYYSDDRETSVRSASAVASAGLTLTVPVLDAAIGAAVRAADASLTVAEANKRALTTTLRHEAARAAAKVRNADLVVAESVAVASGAAANLADVEARYRAGFLGPLDLLDAERTDRDAKLHAIRTELAAKIARVELLFAMGSIDRLSSTQPHELERNEPTRDEITRRATREHP